MSEMTGNTALLAQVCGAGGPVPGAPARHFQPLSAPGCMGADLGRLLPVAPALGWPAVLERGLG